MIGDDPVSDAAFDQVGRDVAVNPIDEAADYGVVAVQFGDGSQAVLVQPALRQHVVDFLADPPVLAVDDVVDDAAVGKSDFPKIAQHVVIVAGGRAAARFTLQFAVGAVAVSVASVAEQPVLVVIGGRCSQPRPAQAVAVGVITVRGNDAAILFDFNQPSGATNNITF